MGTKNRQPYRFEATTIDGFVQQLAVCYVTHGYWFYVTGIIPEGKDPRAVDEKLLKKYGIDISKWTRARRKAAGYANIHYLRHERFFVLIATKGKGDFFDAERSRLKDIRHTPLKFGSYAISYRNGHASVRIEQQTFRDLKAYFEDIAVKRSGNAVATALGSLPFEAYAPIRSQFALLLRTVNRKRSEAGLLPVSETCLSMRRRSIKPFAKADPFEG